MSNELSNLYRVHAEEHSKYVYFILAATGAALGYALQKLDASTFTPSIWLGLAAIAAWLLSFLVGCKHITARQTVLFCNYQMLRLQKKSGPPEVFEAAVDAFNVSDERATRLHKWQFWLLALGVVLFIAWRVVVLICPPSAAL